MTDLTRVFFLGANLTRGILSWGQFGGAGFVKGCFFCDSADTCTCTKQTYRPVNIPTTVTSEINETLSNATNVTNYTLEKLIDNSERVHANTGHLHKTIEFKSHSSL